MTEPRRSRRLPDGTRSGVPGRVDAGPGLLEAVDPALFPGADARRQVDGGAPSERWRVLLDEGSPILADGAMGTMLFLSGLQFGDPPEVWNLTQPDVVRRIHRGYLEAGSRILLTNTFGGNRLRLGLHRLEERVAELNQTAAILLARRRGHRP